MKIIAQYKHARTLQLVEFLDVSREINYNGIDAVEVVVKTATKIDNLGRFSRETAEALAGKLKGKGFAKV